MKKQTHDFQYAERKISFKYLIFLFFFISCLLLNTLVFGQERPLVNKVTGVVKSVTGIVLEDITVKVKNTSKVAKTNNKGEFSIDLPNQNAVLVFTSVNYDETEVIVKDKKILLVVMAEKVSQQDEVIVVGYGKAKKSDITTAATVISTKNLDGGGYSNFQQFLGGKAPGVVVNESSGSEPGGGVSVEIRGTSSLSFNTQPLYVIDGVPLETPDNFGVSSPNANSLIGNGSGASNPLAAINPNDIESISILKDAAATAIYGSRGSNGVVLITTKSGKVGKAKINISVNTALAKPLKTINVLQKNDYITYVNEAWRFRTFMGIGGILPQKPFLDTEIDSLSDYDHQKALQRTAQTTDLNISVSGGNAVSKYYLSGQYFNQQGVVPTTGLKRYNFKFNYEVNLSTKLTLNTSLTITNVQRNGSPTSSFQAAALKWAPTSPLENPDGSLNRISNYLYGPGSSIYNDPTFGSIYYNSRFPATSVSAVSTNNPLSYASSKGVRNINTSNQILGSISLNYQLNKALSVNGLLGITMYNSLLENYIPINIILPFSTAAGLASLGNSQNTKLLYQISGNYIKTFAKKHNLNAVVVATAEKYVSKGQVASSVGFPTDATGYNAIQAGTIPDVPRSSYSGYQLVSSLFRASYNYNYKYYLSVSGRYDGSSKFQNNNRFGFFPSVGVSWRVNKEKWFFDKTGRTVSDFKFKASWGLVGNQGIDPYSTLSTFNTVSTALGGVAAVGYVPSRLANPTLQWEKTESTNLGLEWGFLKDRITFTADIYRKKTNDLLYNVAVPLTSGFTTMTANIANISNEGLELSLNTINVKTKNFKWATGFNISFNKNKVEKLTGSAGDYVDVDQGSGLQTLFRVTPGQPIGQFFGYKSIGVWTNETILTKPATFQQGVLEGGRRFADLNKDGKLSDSDRVYLGTGIPKYTGGFNTAITYKNFELTSFFNFSMGNQIFNYFDMNIGSMNGTNNIRKAAFDARYQKIYSDTDPKLIEAIRANNNVTRVATPGTNQDPRDVCDFFIEDGSFIRCRDITLNYTLPDSFIKRYKLQSIRFYIQAQNIFTITNYSGINPEVNTSGGLARGVDNGTYPIGKSFRAGFNINF